MANVRTGWRSFSGGEITPEMYGNVTDSKYQTGLARCENAIVLPHGPVQKRPGFMFVREAKFYVDNPVRLIPFIYSNDQAMILEFGNGYIRFHTGDGTLMDGDDPYEITTPYTKSADHHIDLFDLRYVQSNDVLTLTHPKVAPHELKRLSALYWTIEPVDFGVGVEPPADVFLDRYGSAPTWPRVLRYVVTSTDEDGVLESEPSGIKSINADIEVHGAFMNVSWSDVLDASGYTVYKEQAGLFGYIGRTTSGTVTSLRDDNIEPDMSKTPPKRPAVFHREGDYPVAVSYFEQRRVFGGTVNQPAHIWMTKSGTESDMSYSIPIRDDDRISFRIAARDASAIEHIVPLSQMLLLTSTTEWRVTSVNSDAITPTSISVRPQSYGGASRVQPVVVNNSAIFAASRGGHLREIAYNWQASGFISGDLSLRAPHLFDGHDIVDLAFVRAPTPIVWAVSSTGKLLGLTYIPEQQIGAWHQHTTQGRFLSIAAVPASDGDAVYAAIARDMGGEVERVYIERMGYVGPVPPAPDPLPKPNPVVMDSNPLIYWPIKDDQTGPWSDAVTPDVAGNDIHLLRSDGTDSRDSEALVVSTVPDSWTRSERILENVGSGFMRLPNDWSSGPDTGIPANKIPDFDFEGSLTAELWLRLLDDSGGSSWSFPTPPGPPDFLDGFFPAANVISECYLGENDLATSRFFLYVTPSTGRLWFGHQRWFTGVLGTELAWEMFSTGNGVVQVGKTHHIALTRIGGTAYSLIVDGYIVGTAGADEPPNSLDASKRRLYIGGGLEERGSTTWPGAGINPSNGANMLVSDISLYDRPLSLSEIRRHYSRMRLRT